MVRTIGIAIPSFNRSQMTIDSFSDVHEDERIESITIVDDASDWAIFTEMKQMTESFPKVRLFRNRENRNCYVNKATAISYSNCDWNILLDSDNKISKDYLDKIFEFNYWEDRTIYTPDFAMPQFDFRNYSDLLITKENVAQYIELPMFETMCNAANYFVNKNEYLNAWDEDTEPMTSDSIYMISRWLARGNKLKVVDGLQYNHLVHSGSHYQNYRHLTQEGFHENILQQIRSMV